MKIETRKIAELHEWEKNPRTITKDAYERLKYQILKLKDYKPLLITPDNTVIGGNMRLKAYRELGMTETLVSIVEPKDENELWEYALSDNDHVGATNADMIANEMPNLNIDWSKYAIDLQEPTTLQELLDQYSDVTEDDVPDVAEGEPVSKYGEVYQLGTHRLICGDATKIEDVMKLMGEEKADMIFTDPPYNMNYTGGGANQRTGILNDKMTKSNFYDFLYDSLANMMTVNKGSFYICMGSKEMDTLKIAFEQAGGHFQSYIIWVKNRFTLSGSDYQNQYESLLYGWVDGKDHYFLNDRGQGVVWYEIGDKAKIVDGKTEIKIGTTTIVLEGIVKGIIRHGKRRTDIWEHDRPSESKEHPTMKPVKLVAEAIKNSSLEGQNVLDLFGGSGTTLIACQQTGRKCLMGELDPKYVDVIRKRYARYLGNEDDWQEITKAIA